MYQVDSEDASFLFLEQEDNPAHISLVALYDQSTSDGHVIRFQHILKHIQNRLSSAPVFHQKIKRIPADLDYPYWIEDDNFDLEYHVRHLALPKPGDWRQFCIQISRLHSRPLDLRRPLWELYVIEGLDHVADLPKASFALYFKIHHCAMDEFTAIELLESLHETTPNPHQHEQNPTQIAHLLAREPGAVDIAAQLITGNISRSVKFSLQSIQNHRYVSRQLLKFGLRTFQRVTSAPVAANKQLPRFAGTPGSARVFEGGFYERELLDRFSALVPGAKLHHALAVVCGEATRLYLVGTDELDGSTLSARLQVNIRNAGAHALSGNNIALQHIELYTGVENLVERLYAIVGSNDSGYENDLEKRRHGVRAVYENIPAPILSILGRWSKSELQSLEAGGSCGISTLAGPAQPVYFLGAKLNHLTSVSPLYKGCGLMYSASQYGDQIAISFTSGRKMLPDPAKLAACLDDTMKAIDRLLANSQSADTKIEGKRVMIAQSPTVS
jgi:diacylglycerol O-acyltransferase